MMPRWSILFAVAIAIAAPQAPALAGNWALTLSIPDQVAAPGGTAVYSGTIANTSGSPIVLSGSLDFGTSPSDEHFTIDFAPELLALNLVIPTSGYTGPILVVSWNSDAVPGSFAVGELLLVARAPTTPRNKTASFTLGTPGFGPFCTSGSGVLASGNSVASDDSTGYPVVVCNSPGGSLAYAAFNGTHWSTTPIAGGIGVQALPSLALDGQLNPHVAFYDAVAGDLVHAWNSGTGWQSEIVESSGDVGAEPSLVVDANNELHVSYYDATHGDLRYAHRHAGTWTTELVDAAGDVGHYSSVATDELGQPYISYYDATSEDLKLAHRSGASWIAEVVDAGGSRGAWSSARVMNGEVSISYRDATPGSPALRFAHGAPGSWTKEVVDSSGAPGQGTRLVLNTFGQPRIAYFDAASSQVRFASKTGTTWSSRDVAPSGSTQLSLTRNAHDEPYLTFGDGVTGELKFASLTVCGTASVPGPGAAKTPLLVLYGSWPNPFSARTTFAIGLARAAEVRVRVFDVAGRQVAEPIRRRYGPGLLQLSWNGTGAGGRRLPPGGYMYEVRSGSESRVGRLVLLR